VRAYPRESQEMVKDAHDRAFAFFRARGDFCLSPDTRDQEAFPTAHRIRRQLSSPRSQVEYQARTCMTPRYHPIAASSVT
jgi:hypothetical protein